MNKREMVEVILFEDGIYEINDIDEDYATQKLTGHINHKNCSIYHCKKKQSKKYLLKLMKDQIKDVDDEVKRLKKCKAKLNTIKNKLEHDLEESEE